MDEEQLISVIIPVYNCAAYLSECLDSILNNTYRRLEVVCVNDGSTDASLDILNDYAARDSRVVVINQENQGVSTARNVGMQAAKGEWFSFVDSDDAVNCCFFENLMTTWREFEETPDVVVCGRIWHEAERLPDTCEVISSDTPDCLVDWDARCQDIVCWGFMWGKIYHRRIIEGYYVPKDLALSEDTYFNVMLIMGRGAELQMARSDKALYYYRRNTQSSSFRHAPYRKIDTYSRMIEETPSMPVKPCRALSYEISAVQVNSLRMWIIDFNGDREKYRQCNDLLSRCLSQWRHSGFLSKRNFFQYGKYLFFYYFPHAVNLLRRVIRH